MKKPRQRGKGKPKTDTSFIVEPIMKQD